MRRILTCALLAIVLATPGTAQVFRKDQQYPTTAYTDTAQTWTTTQTFNTPLVSTAFSLRTTDGVVLTRTLALRGVTVNTTPTELVIEPGQYLTLAPGTSHGYRIDLVARETTGVSPGRTAFWSIRTGAANNAGTSVLVGSTLTEIVHREGGWLVDVDVDDTNDRLAVTVTGSPGSTVKWAAHVVEITLAD